VTTRRNPTVTRSTVPSLVFGQSGQFGVLATTRAIAASVHESELTSSRNFTAVLHVLELELKRLPANFHNALLTACSASGVIGAHAPFHVARDRATRPEQDWKRAMAVRNAREDL